VGLMAHESTPAPGIRYDCVSRLCLFDERPPRPVTNQVTTASGKGRRGATYRDIGTALTSGNPTQRDVIRRNGHAW
jgi:hypothetical protein